MTHNLVQLIWNDLQEKTGPGGDLAAFWRNAQLQADGDNRNYCLLIWTPDDGTLAESEGAIFRVKARTLKLSGDIDPDSEPAFVISLTALFRELRR